MTNYDLTNIFAKIIKGQIPCTKIAENDDFLAFEDISKAAPIHIITIPKQQFTSFEDFSQNADSKLIANFWRFIQKITEEQNITEGYRLITNVGSDANQTVKHFHSTSFDIL
jgi:diadenosine tetraphosphate (Ap4A) HIT family hydrolase